MTSIGTRMTRQDSTSPRPSALARDVYSHVSACLERAIDVTLPLADRVQVAVSRTPSGHLRPLHWACLGLFLWVVGVLPVLLGAREDWIFQLPLGLALVGGWCILHAFASAAAQSGGGEQ